MMTKYEIFGSAGEFYAAGFFKDETASYQRRLTDAAIEYLDRTPIPPWNAGNLYPAGKVDFWNVGKAQKIYRHYSYSIGGTAARKLPATGLEDRLWNRGIDEIEFVCNIPRPPRFLVGGSGWTHAIINYRRLLKEGFYGYLARIGEARKKCDSEFLRCLEDLLQALIRHHARVLESLRETAPAGLLAALNQVPCHGARTLYEAFVACNYLWYIDGVDSLGRIDAVLAEYCPAGGEQEAEALFAEFWHNFDQCDGWHVLLGTNVPMSRAAIRAQRKYRRPNSGCLVGDDTPPELWDEIFDSWAAGNPSPSLYAEENYRKHLSRFLPVSVEDRDHFAFGGCTELMIEGCSNIGSVDFGLNILDIFSQVPIGKFTDYETFYEAFESAVFRQLDIAMSAARDNHKYMADYRPQMIRSLFTDDCIESGVEFNAGGARYNGSVVCVAGFTNTVNSLYSLKMVFEGKAGCSPAELEAALKDDFQHAEPLRRTLEKLPKFGNDLDGPDHIGEELSKKIFRRIGNQKGARNNSACITGVILFTTYEFHGSYVAATPDGRHAGAPICDSVGAMQGTDLNGPTALLKSVARLDLKNALGTPILNLRLSRNTLQGKEARQKLIALFLSYFAMGGLQIQPSIVDDKLLCEAIENPDRYPELIIRIGGYSEYFNRLTPGLRAEVLKRMEHHI